MGQRSAKQSGNLVSDEHGSSQHTLCSTYKKMLLMTRRNKHDKNMSDIHSVSQWGHNANRS